MIQPTDLRIGNLFHPTKMVNGIRLPQHVPFKVVELHAFDLFCVKADDTPALVAEWTTMEYIEIEPIPLSEEWLKRMGFEEMPKGSGAWYLNAELFDMGGIGSISSEFELTGKAGHYEYSHEVPPIKYVHTLQNLFFALRGSELTINL